MQIETGFDFELERSLSNCSCADAFTAGRSIRSRRPSRTAQNDRTYMRRRWHVQAFSEEGATSAAVLHSAWALLLATWL